MKVDINIAKNFTQDEKEIFGVLREVVKKYTPSTQIFAVGGWVRDRLIGITQSDDLDIMVSNISGESFAKLVTNYLQIKDPHVIRANPEASKNIESAKCYIPLSSGKIQEVDFAQARSEVYKENSRIPDVKPATPQLDAMRRDLTVNSIFYNIMENKIEDFTGMGIKDLISDTARTPEDPLKTFSDDPLRIFRVARFSSKYNFKIDPETYKAMTDPSLRNEINQKISKERISEELKKMLKNPHPEKAIQLLKDTGLFDDIITQSIKGTQYEGQLAPLDMDQNNPWHNLTLFNHTMEVFKQISEKYNAEPEKRVIMLLSALMHDLGKTYKKIWTDSKSHPGKTSYIGHEFESAKLAELIMRYLKMENSLIENVSKITSLHMRLHSLDKAGENAFRKYIRQMSEKSLDYLDLFNLATADALAKDIIKDPEVIQKYKDIENKLQQAVSSLSNNAQAPISQGKMKPILNGQEVIQILNIKPGIWMNQIMEFVKELRDTNPNITKEEAANLLKEKYQNNDFKKQASNDSKDEENKSPASLIPIPLLKKKIEEVNKLFSEKKYYEVFSTIDQLREEYGNDENVTRLLAISSFKLLLKGEEYRYNDLLNYVMEKATMNFFDHILCSYALGILILIETQTEEKPIKIIGERMLKMSPSTLKNVLNMLPNKVFRPKIKKELLEKL